MKQSYSILNEAKKILNRTILQTIIWPVIRYEQNKKLDEFNQDNNTNVENLNELNMSQESKRYIENSRKAVLKICFRINQNYSDF